MRNLDAAQFLLERISHVNVIHLIVHPHKLTHGVEK